MALAAAVAGAGSAAVGAQAPAAGAPPSDGGRREVFARYCVSCHTEAQKTRGAVPVALETLDLGNIGAHAELWERVVLKVRAGVMPPAGMPRPDRATLDSLVGWVESQLDRAAAARPNPGRTEPLHRLNRTEYRNAVRDLLGLDLDVSPLLPPDDSSYGFDNMAGVLKLSPTLMERYLSAALKVSRLAVGSAGPSGNIDYFRVADDLSQDRHVDGMPLGTRGGIRVRYVFPIDGEYEFRPRLARDLNEQVPSLPRRSGARGERRRHSRRRVHAGAARAAAATLRRLRPRPPRRRRARPRRSGPRSRRSRPVSASAPRSARRATAPTKPGTSACRCGPVSARWW